MRWRLLMIIVIFVVLNVVREWGAVEPQPRRPLPETSPAPDYGDMLRPLPESSGYDMEISVGLGEKQDSTGTAFAVGANGWWMTARHVVDQCAQVQLRFPYHRGMLAARVVPHPGADLALLQTNSVPPILSLAGRQLYIGQNGFHVGYPRGRPGEIWSTLMGRRRLRITGRYRTNEPVVVWAERGRRPAGLKSLGGLSGGPTVDGAGGLVGVLVAESRRRGRVYTAAPVSINQLLPEEIEKQPSGRVAGITPGTLGAKADEMRRSPSIAKVVCLARGGGWRRG